MSLHPSTGGSAVLSRAGLRSHTPKKHAATSLGRFSATSGRATRRREVPSGVFKFTVSRICFEHLVTLHGFVAMETNPKYRVVYEIRDAGLPASPEWASCQQYGMEKQDVAVREEPP
jgi:hypothetical protein